MKWIIGIGLFLVVASCNLQTTKKGDFRKFADEFTAIELPITNQLNRVYNSDLVSNRIDTTNIISFIDSTYQRKNRKQLFNGYAYAVTLPKDTFNYQGLIYLHVTDSSIFFVLNTYNAKGQLLSKLPLSGELFDKEHLSCEIDTDRNIYLSQRSFSSNTDSTFIYQINHKGYIVKKAID